MAPSERISVTQRFCVCVYAGGRARMRIQARRRARVHAKERGSACVFGVCRVIAT